MITEININDIPKKRKGRAPGVAITDITEFIESGALAAKVDIPDGKKACHIQSTYFNAAKRLNAGVRVIQRNNEVYLVKDGKYGEQ